ncbi:hypothetical protein BaRGS_00011394 [Batillaria attramentaria]|uniref:Uncharacterized protein n=1 Tax=Batillaria attramentaria TaxID=370345 RepID=A0ABD0LDE8_9CAEN
MWTLAERFQRAVPKKRTAGTPLIRTNPIALSISRSTGSKLLRKDLIRKAADLGLLSGHVPEHGWERNVRFRASFSGTTY